MVPRHLNKVSMGKDRVKSKSGGKHGKVNSLAQAIAATNKAKGLGSKESKGGVNGKDSEKRNKKKPAYQKSWAKFSKDGKKTGDLPSSEAVHKETDKKRKKE